MMQSPTNDKWKQHYTMENNKNERQSPQLTRPASGESIRSSTSVSSVGTKDEHGDTNMKQDKLEEVKESEEEEGKYQLYDM